MKFLMNTPVDIITENSITTDKRLSEQTEINSRTSKQSNCKTPSEHEGVGNGELYKPIPTRISRRSARRFERRHAKLLPSPLLLPRTLRSE